MFYVTDGQRTGGSDGLLMCAKKVSTRNPRRRC